jgi:hypothetical protein
MLESFEMFFIPDGVDNDRERGQILLLLALAMVGLLVAAGLAVDGGVLFMRRAQLERAVDAAALAGVVRLTESNDPWEALSLANTRGQQVLAGNTFETSNPGPTHGEYDASTDCTLDTHDYCGSWEDGDLPGSIRYHVESETLAEVYFMRLVGFENIPLRSAATAEYIPLVDIYASEALQTGVLRSSNQAVFGPGSCTHMGDPYSPTYNAGNGSGGYSNDWYDELGGVYQYRIRIPESYIYNSDGTVQYDQIRIELFDPETANQSGSSFTTYNQEGDTGSVGCSDRRQPCLDDVQLTGDGDETPFWWFVRIDENRRPPNNYTGATCSEPSSYTASYNTRTEFRLYYLQEQTDGSLMEVDLAYYIGKIDSGAGAAEAQATDMHWVTPGADCPDSGGSPDYGNADCELMPPFTYDDVYGNGNTSIFSAGEPITQTEACPTCTTASDGNFMVQLVNQGGDSSETPGIYVDPQTGRRDLYLDVRVLDGYSENGYEIWAGPPRTAGSVYEVPSYVNARQMYITRELQTDPDFHNSEGAGVFGIGHLPMNSNTTNRVDIPLAYLGPEFGGQNLSVSLFDPDSGHSPPISFWFEGIPRNVWMACFADDDKDCDDPLPDGPGGERWQYIATSGTPINNQWRTLEFPIPTESSDGTGIPFYGGILYASYEGGNHDTYGWKITIDSRPYLIE